MTTFRNDILSASISTDFAVYANQVENSVPYIEAIDHGGTLPDLPVFNISMYTSPQPSHPLATTLLAAYIRAAYTPAVARAAE